ncbi:MAG: hypothetical protein M1820_008294 [Bogoriella megaspora]|nr:MAG: hypothetical protein M1820_008294 [Bogoriella megaspora]
MAEAQSLSGGAKLSRYRSVRKATQQDNFPQPPPEPKTSTATSDSLVRSRSRYHRPNTIVTPAPKLVPERPHLGVTTQIIGNAERANVGKPREAADQTAQAKEKARKLIAKEAERQQRARSDTREEKGRPHVEKAWRVTEKELESPTSQTEEALRQNEERKIRAQKRQEAAVARHQQSRPSATRDTEISRSSRRDQPATSRTGANRADGAIRSEQPAQMAREPSNEDATSKGMFGFLKRRKPSDPSKLSMPTSTSSLPVKSSPREPETIKPGGGGVVPGIDAPRTAINAGERRVLLECNNSSIQLPVTPETTPSDLINSAANCLSERINPKSSVLLESFSKAGVQRRLRMYEHVRDVMNSWDSDSQNSLMLVEAASGEVDFDLTTNNVPREQPPGDSFALYYSQKPGKWDKRWVTIQGDGQITLAKIGSSKKESTNVCHLSDFDIYTPTRKQMSKKIKPPKKHCFAVKSQQKSGIFMSTTNFVHFFATSDRDTGAEFYKVVHGWRSWYLVNVMGEGKKRKESNASKPAFATPAETQRPGTGHRRSISADQGRSRKFSEDSHYQIGSFKPLIDPASLDPKLDANAPLPKSFHSRRFSQDATQVSPETKEAYQRNMSMRNRSHPPVSYPKKLQKEDPNRPDNVSSNRPRTASATSQSNPPPTAESTFAPTSLLGRSYSQRQAQQREREVPQTSPFTAGPSLMNGGLETEPPSTANTSNLSRRLSTRQNQPTNPVPSTSAPDPTARTTSLTRGPTNKRLPPRPLVDLTPTYREPPQHTRKGRGFHPTNPSPHGLIDNATSPEDPIAAPPSTSWRNPANDLSLSNSIPLTSPPVSMSTRTKSLKGTLPGGLPSPLHQANATPRLSLEQEGFTREGLLAQLRKEGQGGAATGRGVATGWGDGKAPMLDLREERRFVKGSLLAGRERDGVGGIGEAL